MTTALDMLRRVAQRTREYDFTVWFWGEAIAVDGLIEAAELTGDMANLAHARRFLGTADRPLDWVDQQLRDLCEAVVEVQDSTPGLRRTLLHDRDAYLETSVTAFFGTVYTAGVAAGLLSDSYREAADRAWEAIRSRVDPDGSCWGVSACTWAGSADVNDDAMYKTLPTEVNVWGQGSVRRFAAERIRAGQA